MAGVISDDSIPEIPRDPVNSYIKTNETTTKGITETAAYSCVSLIFMVIVVMFIGIMINDINCKILNIYYNTKRYNNNIIIKMFIV
jgi:hypothetical protein